MSEPKRKVLGIIGCEVLEDEIVHVVSTDEEVSKIIVTHSPEASNIAHKLRERSSGKPIESLKEDALENGLREEGFIVILKILPIALHQVGTDLRERVENEVERLGHVCDAILLFYGLCGNTFRNIDAIASKHCTPLVILRDSQDNIVDDCVGTVLGGTDEYLSFLRQDKGGYPLNTMWANNWRHYMRQTQLISDENNVDEAKMVFEFMGYTSVVKLDTGLGDKEAYDRLVEEFASTFGLKVVNIDCTTKVVERSYLTAKKMIN